MALIPEETKLEREIAGWTVTGIEEACEGEQIFAIIVRNGDKQKRVTISATDLGWWIEKVEHSEQLARERYI